MTYWIWGVGFKSLFLRDLFKTQIMISKMIIVKITALAITTPTIMGIRSIDADLVSILGSVGTITGGGTTTGGSGSTTGTAFEGNKPGLGSQLLLYCTTPKFCSVVSS
jgi:hypothetical protein